MLDHLEHVPDFPGLPDGEQQVLLKALAKDPEERYATCTEFIRALERALGGPIVTRLGTESRAATYKPASQVGGPTQGNKDAPVLSGNPGVGALATEPHESAHPQSQGTGLAGDDTPHTPRTVQMKAPAAGRGKALLIAAAVGVAVAVGGVVGWRLAYPPGGITPSTSPSGPNNHEEVKTPVVPAGFKAATDEVVEDFKKRRLFKALVIDRADSPSLKFLLIEQRRATDPPSFYVMETKVSNAAFAAFAKAKPLAGEPDWAKLPAELPALGMSAERAGACAAWLGGELPTTGQWDKAAGFWDRERRDGPAKGLRVAVNRRGKGPLPVDAPGEDDVSVFGAKGMAGNGTELTRDVIDRAGIEKLVILRGQRFQAWQALTFKDLEEQQNEKDAQVQRYEAKSPFTGFRVVVEVAK